MKQYKPYIMTTLLACSSLAITAAHANTSNADPSAAKLEHVVTAKPKIKNNIELMFFQHAKHADISKDKKNPNCYRMVLSDLKDQVIYFSDQPQRITGSLTLSEFMDSWRRHKKQYGIRPNAILHATTGDKNKPQAVNDIAELTSLKYDPKAQTLSYIACPLDAKKPFALATLNDVNLFIDPFHGWPP